MHTYDLSLLHILFICPPAHVYLPACDAGVRQSKQCLWASKQKLSHVHIGAYLPYKKKYTQACDSALPVGERMTRSF
jgi:hypothetical protein